MSTLTLQNYADISSAVYDDLKVNKDKVQNLLVIPKGSENKYYVHLKESNPETGFQAYLLEKADADGRHTGEFITAFRGSSSAKDWENNFTLLRDGEHAQTKEALGFAKKAHTETLNFSEAKKLPYSMANTGHSLGGAFAQMAHLENGAPTYTFNALPAPLFNHPDTKKPFVFPNPDSLPIYNQTMALDVANTLVDKLPGSTTTYARNGDIRILRMTDYNTKDLDDDNPKTALVLDTLTKTSHSITQFTGEKSVLLNPEKHINLAEKHENMIKEFRKDMENEYQEFKKGGKLFRAAEIFLHTVGGKYEGNDKKAEEQKNQSNHTPNNQNNTDKPILQKQESSTPTISPKHQQFIQQCEDSLMTICKEKGITAEHPQDFKNIAAAIAAKGITEKGMDRVEKATIEGLNFYVGSYSPYTKIVSVNVHEAVHIPVHESMEKIQQLEQQTAQKAQERQITQEQNQGRSMV